MQVTCRTSAGATRPDPVVLPLVANPAVPRGTVWAPFNQTGADIREAPGDGRFGPDLVITPGPIVGGAAIDCGLAGTAMRFLPIMAALGEGAVAFDGETCNASLCRTRPTDSLMRQAV